MEVFLDVGHAWLGEVGVLHPSWPRPVDVALTTKGGVVERTVGGGAKGRLGTLQGHGSTDGRGEVEWVLVRKEGGPGVGSVLVGVAHSCAQ